MSTLINGLHHVTAMASGAQPNLDFYVGVLGLRLVKKTVNFDAPDIYHLYYGDGAGAPASIMTVFPFRNMHRGRRGTGQLTATAFSIAADAVGYWTDRLQKLNVPFEGPARRLGEEVITLHDPDDLELELVAGDDPRSGWQNDAIAPGMEIKGFHSVSLCLEGYEHTAQLLTEVMEHRLVAEEHNRFRFTTGDGGAGRYVDLVCMPDAQAALPGSGTVHHVAFSTATDQTQLAFRDKLLASGFANVTPVLDRQYFHSIYYREPGGVLFEVATDPPGFAVDESPESLGTTLKLPQWLESRRAAIARSLPQITVPTVRA